MIESSELMCRIGRYSGEMENIHGIKNPMAMATWTEGRDIHQWPESMKLEEVMV